MTLEDSIQEDSKIRIEEAIRLAELGTSGEIRVHVENKCKEDVLDRAAFIFSALDMHLTKQRNGVLIYIALSDRKFAIIGDAGIHEKIGSEYWDQIRSHAQKFFREENVEGGIIDAIERVGEKIRSIYPILPDDRNEITNKLSTHKNLKKR